MDFVTGLPRGKKRNDAIWVVVDRLTKSALFLPMKMTDSVDKVAKLYVNEVIRLHGVPVSIISDRDPRFTSRLWPSLQQAMGTKLNLSTTFHPQTDGQSKRTIQTLEDLLGSYVLEFGGNWEDLLPVYLDKIQNMFHVSLLRKAKIDPSRVLPQVPLKIKGDLTMKTKSVKILDRDEKLLRNK
jgi:hypothetical protein